MAIYVTRHAEESYRIFYPEADCGDILKAIEGATEVEVDIALRMCGRDSRPSSHEGTYLLHPERTGLFVMGRADRYDDGTIDVITFLRFYSDNQRRLAVELFGAGGSSLRHLVRTDRTSLALDLIGVPVKDIKITNGAASVMGGRVKVRDALLNSVVRKPTEAELSDLEHIAKMNDEILCVIEHEDKLLCVARHGRSRRVFADSRQTYRGSYTDGELDHMVRILRHRGWTVTRG